MSIREHFKNAWRSIKANKTRTVLSCLWIIIWVSSVIILLAFWEWTRRNITDQIQSLWSNLITITPWNSKLTDVRRDQKIRDDKNIFLLSDMALLRKLPNVVWLSPQVNTKKQLIYESKNTSSTVNWVTTEFMWVRGYTLNYGEFINDQHIAQWEKVAVLWSEVLKNLFNNENPLGKKIRIWNVFFTVIGVMQEKWWSAFNNPDDAVFIPITTAQKRLIWSDFLNQIAVQADTAENVDRVKETVITTLMAKYDIKDRDQINFTIITSSDTLKTANTITWFINAFLLIVASVSLIVWWIWIMNIMLVSVSERTREIWIRRSIWALDSDIITQFLTESIVLTSIGWLIGILFSIGVVTLIQTTWTKAYVTTNSLLLSVGCSIATWVLFGRLPARNAAKLKPIDALRSD